MTAPNAKGRFLQRLEEQQREMNVLKDRLDRQESDYQSIKVQNEIIKDRLEEEESINHSLKTENDKLANRLENLEKWKRRVDKWLIENFEGQDGLPVEEADNATNEPNINNQIQNDDQEAQDDFEPVIAHVRSGLDTSMEFAQVSSHAELFKNEVTSSQSSDEPEAPEVKLGPVLLERTMQNSIDNGPQVPSSSTSSIQVPKRKSLPKNRLSAPALADQNDSEVPEPTRTDQSEAKARGPTTARGSTPLKRPTITTTPTKNKITDYYLANPGPSSSSKRIKTSPRGQIGGTGTSDGTLKENQDLVSDEEEVEYLGQQPKDSTKRNSQWGSDVGKVKMEVDQDAPCAVCENPDEENRNLILFCDGPGCNLPLHQACYQVLNIPETDEPWFCDPCAKGVKPGDLQCCVCFNFGGALKIAATPAMNKWVHVYCAWWIPGLKFGTKAQSQLVIGFSNINRDTFKLTCTVCKIKDGPKIQCNKGKCTIAYHPICAKNAKFKMIMKDGDFGGTGDLSYISYCKTHSRQITVKV